jgi:hypothetical protein
MFPVFGMQYQEKSGNPGVFILPERFQLKQIDCGSQKA